MKTIRPHTRFTAALATALLLLPTSLQASVSEKFTTSATFTPPPGVTSVTVEVWGGGGAGGSAQFGTVISAGGGGGGGAYAKKIDVPVTPGVEYAITIPSAATAPASGFSTGDRVNGADITFTGNSGVSVAAAGGIGGASSVDKNGSGQQGEGAAANPEADVSWSGGNPASTTNGGGGGAGASDLENGNNSPGNNNPAPTTLGSDPDHNGGAGGSGVTGSNNGGAAASPGGGGGGAKAQSGTRRGGAGGRGQVIVSYTGATATKADNEDDLDLASSWVGGNAPDAAGTALWDNTVTSANTTNLGNDLEWGNIQIANPGGLVTINEGNTLTLTGGIDMSAATQNFVLNADLVTGGPTTWDLAAGRTLTLGGIVSGSSNIAKQGDGTVVLSGANTYSGATAVNGGTLQLGAANVIPNGTGKGDVAVGTGSTLDLNGFSDMINGLSGTGIVDNTAADTTSTLTVGGNNATSTFGGVMSNTGSGSTLNLAKIGSGQLTLTGVNTLTGSVTVSGGNLTINNANALGTISGLTIGGAQLGLNSNNAVVSAPVTLTGNMTVIAQTTAMLLTSLNGPIDGTGNITFTTIAPTLSGADSKVSIGAPGNFTGNVTITTARELNNMTVRLGAENALPATAVVTLDGGEGNNNTWADLNLFGHNQTLAGLANVARSGRLQRVYNSSEIDVTLTIDNPTNRTFGGRLGNTGGNNFALVKSGTGTFTLTGANTHTGATTVSEGTLALVGGSQASPITVEAGASLGFVPGSPTTSSSSVDLAAGGVNIIGSPVPGIDQRLMTATGGFTGTPTLASPVPGFGLELRAGNTQLWLVATSGVATVVIDLGAGTVIEGGTFITSGPTNLPLPPLPAGSILTSIAVNTTLTATDNSNFASDLAVLLDPTPATPGGDFSVEITNGNPKFGAAVTLGWPASANDGVGTALVDTKTSADWSALGSIDLATTGLFLGNAHGGPIVGGTWTGTITLSYLAPAAETGYAAWAEANVGGQGPELDFDGDGVANGIEFFLNAPPGFTALPTLDGNNTITWTNGGNIPASAYGTQFVVQTSGNLVDWTDVPVGELTTNTDGPGGSLTYTLTGGSPRFVRLKLMPD